MRVAFFGDTHGNLKFMWQLALDWQEVTGRRLDRLFQVGDFGVWPSVDRLDRATLSHAQRHGYPLEQAVGDFPQVLSGEYSVPIPTYFIRGNHEDQEFLLDLQRPRRNHYLHHPISVTHNLWYLADGCIFELGGQKFASWGGSWGKKTWEMGYWSNDRLRSRRRQNHLTRDIFERLIRERFDILVTHDAPTGMGVRGRPNPYGSNAVVDPESITENQPEGAGVVYISQLIEACQPGYHFCGHWHQFRQAQIGRTASTVLDKVQPDRDPASAWAVIEI